MRMHDSLRYAGRAGGKEHRRRIGARAFGNHLVDQCRSCLEPLAPLRQQLVVGDQLVLRVMTHAARIVVNDARETLTLRRNLEQLVHLLLVLGEDDRDAGVLDREGHLRGHRVLVERHRNGAQALAGRHGGVEARPVVADEREVLATLQAESAERRGDGAHFLRELTPGPRLPDAEVLLANGRTLRAHARVVHEQLRERVQRLDVLFHRDPPLA